MSKIALMCDSSADITEQEAKELDIHVLRMPIVIKDKEYIEGVNIDDSMIIEALNNNESVKTSQPLLGDMVKMWHDLLETYDEVFYLPLTYALSGTCNIALQAAKNFDGKVTVVNSEFVCYPVIKMLLTARAMFKKGYTTAQVREKIETEGNMLAALIPENLTTLKNGGRISPAAASLAGLLKIQPILCVDHGAIDVVAKVRTLKKAYIQGIEYITKGVNPADYDWMIIDADNRKMSDELKVMLEEAVHQPVEQHEFKAIIMSHTGQGTIGFGRIKKIKY
ncbi:DegV family protein [Faecalitalea cylindroides]|uniref:DegV family protein n=1 Tax=Faecalitalea cylindroides TaxID=39483 RepID=UPI0039F4900E